VKFVPLFASCAIAGTLVPCAALAQATFLSAAVEAAWVRSVQMKSAEGQLELAAAQQSAAQSLWAAPPAVELSHRTDRLQDSLGRTESEVGFAWPLFLPGQRSSRQSAAQAERAVAEAALAAAKLRLAGEVREAAWTVVARQAESSVATRHAQSLEALANDVERRVKAGDLARADALAARAEYLSASAAAGEARLRLATARAQWLQLTGMEQVADPAEPTRPAAAPHPEVALATLTAQGARSRLDLVRASRMEAPELTVRYRRDTAGAGLPAENSVGIAIRIPLGTEDRNLPREKAALAELETAKAEQTRQQRRLEGEIATGALAVRIAEEQEQAEASRVELLRERAALIEKSFRAGEGALPELLRASAAAAQAEAALAGQRAALGLARARLNQVNGQLP
jgi:outer membrane protein TolC